MKSIYAEVHGSVSVNASACGKVHDRRSKTLPESSPHDCETSSMIVALHEASL